MRWDRRRLDDIDLSGLDPGVRGTVDMLRSYGFETTDSGDGVSKFKEGHGDDAAGCIAGVDYCALRYPHVFIVADGDRLVNEAHRLLEVLAMHYGVIIQPCGVEEGDPRIQVTYDPATWIGVIELANVDDSRLLLDTEGTGFDEGKRDG